MDKEGRGRGRGRRGEEDLIFIPEVQKHRAERVFCCHDIESRALIVLNGFATW